MDETQLLSDDLTPSDGSTVYTPPGPDEHRVKAESAERAIVQAAAPMFGRIFELLDREIAALDSIDRVQPESRISVEAQIHGLKYAKSSLQGVKSQLEIMQRAHLK